MSSPLVDNPQPDFASLVDVLQGKRQSNRVFMVELFLDEEMLQCVTERYMGEKWISLGQSSEGHYRQLVNAYYRLGYDYVPLHHWHNFLNQPEFDMPATDDTAELSSGKRKYVVSGHAQVRNRGDFERIDWDIIEPDFSPYAPVISSLPDGMKIVCETTFFQFFTDVLFGYDGLALMLYDAPNLVKEAVETWGSITMKVFQRALPMPEVGAVFHTDDLAFKNNTFLPREVCREIFLPWIRRYADMAHDHGKPFWFHCCGDIYSNGTIDDLLEYVGIDAFHSFQDTILPVAQFKRKYGQRCATLGGVDMDKLCRMTVEQLGCYVRGILDSCMPGGRFALGSGNTVTNYTPVDNYAAMIHEGRKWSQ